MENEQCPKCGNKLYHNKGISKKNNEPYENYKCSNKDCGYIDWVDLKGKQPVSSFGAFKKKGEPDWEEIRKEKAEGLSRGAAFNKSCDIAIALYQKGDITADVIVSKIAGLLPQLKALNENGKENLPKDAE